MGDHGDGFRTVDRDPRSGRRVAMALERHSDAIGITSVALLALWVGVVAGGGEGRPWPVILLLAALVVATAAGRKLAVRPGLVHRSLAVAIAGSMVLTWPGVLSAGGAPLGYANGNATLGSLGLIAAITAAGFERDAALRRGWHMLAGLLALLTIATGSVAGVVALAVGIALVGLNGRCRRPGLAVVGGLVAVSLAVGGTTAVALGSDVFGLGERMEIRGELWTAAADFAIEEPVRGIGVGEFAERNPVSSDADLQWAHHGYLQAAAEYGVVGLALAITVASWAWSALWTSATHQSAPAVPAAAALAIVGIHGAVDYVWHLPPVLLVTAALIGAATRHPGQHLARPTSSGRSEPLES